MEPSVCGTGLKQLRFALSLCQLVQGAGQMSPVLLQSHPHPCAGNTKLTRDLVQGPDWEAQPTFYVFVFFFFLTACQLRVWRKPNIKICTLGFGLWRVVGCAGFDLTLCNDRNNSSSCVGFLFISWRFLSQPSQNIFQAMFLIQSDLKRFGKSHFLRLSIQRAATWFWSVNAVSEPLRFFPDSVHKKILRLFPMISSIILVLASPEIMKQQNLQYWMSTFSLSSALHPLSSIYHSPCGL